MPFDWTIFWSVLMAGVAYQAFSMALGFVAGFVWGPYIARSIRRYLGAG